jgi:hypothetical protein
MQQFNRLIQFRQAVYEHGLTKARDSQFELLDALLLSRAVRSFPELTLHPVFRRQWHSAYTAIEDGNQDWDWLEETFRQLVTITDPCILALDGTDWPHPQARTLADCQYVHCATAAVNGGDVIVGHPYSLLTWIAEPGTSWAPPVSVRRVPSHQTETEMGVKQVQDFCRFWKQVGADSQLVVVADGRYSNQHFLGGLAEEPCVKLARMRRDRVLYGEPGPYPGHGRPRKHGDRFAFKEPETWGPAAAAKELDDPRWGQVRLRRWDHLHAKQDADTTFSVLLVESHRERDRPSEPFWVAYQPPPGQEPGTYPLEFLWRCYQGRWPVEPSIRFRKQELHWTLPRFQTPERCDRWTMLVTIAQWILYLAREEIGDHPLPWQPPQERLTPERVRQGLGVTFVQIGTPAQPPQTRGKSPGWPTGRPRTRPQRHKVIKKDQKGQKPG